MLVKCRNRGVEFDHKLGRCVACGTVPEPTDEERAAALVEDATAWLADGARPALARKRLIDEFRLPERLAEDVLADARAVRKAKARSHGRRLVTSGVVLLVIAVGVFLFTGGLAVASGCLALGVLMVLFGEIKIVTGWNITRHDEA